MTASNPRQSGEAPVAGGGFSASDEQLELAWQEWEASEPRRPPYEPCSFGLAPDGYVDQDDELHVVEGSFQDILTTVLAWLIIAYVEAEEARLDTGE